MRKPRLRVPLFLLSLPAAVFLQATLLANSLPGGGTPDLGFLLTVAAGFLGGAAGGACCGMWAGALVGAGAGALAVPMSCLYGLVGWLAGCHSEFRPRRWTFPLVTIALALLTVSGHGLLGLWLDGRQPPLWWKFSTAGWMSVAGLGFLFLPSGTGGATESV